MLPGGSCIFLAVLVEQRSIFKSFLGNWMVWGRPVLGRQWRGNEGEESCGDLVYG